MKMSAPILMLMTLSLSVLPLTAERINQEGRILGPLPVVTSPLLFNTNDADAVLTAMQIFPVTNPWNEDISRRPLLANSDAMITQINADVGASNRKLKLFQEMNFALVPDNQPLVNFSFFGGYPDQSDLNGGAFPVGLYPIPTNLPVEGWPSQTGGQTLLQNQTVDDGGDRHAIMVQPGAGMIFESWRTLHAPSGWLATNGAIFNLKSNNLRPDGWTSGDAAGFPMFPALVRYDECERGMVEHACRLVVVRSRSQHIYPATHDAGSRSAAQTNYPAMGQRLRLKAGYVIPANWTKEEKALLLGLKKYGAMVSDNSSSFFSISITPDDRWGSKLDHIINGSIGITNFEVIQTTGPTEGPRSAGAPAVNAGADQMVVPSHATQLAGFVSFSNTPPVILWQAYSGPGTVTFGNAAQTNTMASFNTPGTYLLELSADDGVHAVAYDAVIITVTNGITVFIVQAGKNVNLSWTGGSPPYIVQSSGTLPATSWNDLVTTSANNTNIPILNTPGYFRVKGQ